MRLDEYPETAMLCYAIYSKAINQYRIITNTRSRLGFRFGSEPCLIRLYSRKKNALSSATQIETRFEQEYGIMPEFEVRTFELKAVITYD